jgi:hypothetical protein
LNAPANLSSFETRSFPTSDNSELISKRDTKILKRSIAVVLKLCFVVLNKVGEQPITSPTRNRNIVPDFVSVLTFDLTI